ncbi:PQQ-binding-like beta-propeller repeat protein [Plantactinospora sp. B6F1]|uniref:outer membrane protein assembly factor BamB family protein n=1 Tax=Plantactinospora sp. B6F1 TaxID=3158971 RepID=UPI0010D01663
MDRFRLLPLVLSLALVTGCGLLPTKNGGEPEVEGPHRVPAKEAFSDGGDKGTPETVSHHWVGLSKVWEVPQLDEVPHRYGLVSDGTRFVGLRKEIDGSGEAELTGYDGASGKKLWRQQLPWAAVATPVASGETVVVPLGEEHETLKTPVEFVALDTTTGQERWRAKVSHRAFMGNHVSSRPAPEPGAILDGVFYYADGAKLIGRDLVTGKVRYQRTSKSHYALVGPRAARDHLVVLVRPDPLKDTEGINTRVRSVAVLSKALKPVHQFDFPEGEAPDEMVTSGDIVVVTSHGEPGRMWGLDARTGKNLWDQPLPRKIRLGLPVGGVLSLVDEEYRFIGHDMLTGEQLWTLATRKGDNQSLRGRMVGVADGTLFGLGHGVEIVDTASGKVIFGHQFTPRGGGLVVAAGGRIVIYNHDGFMGFE